MAGGFGGKRWNQVAPNRGAPSDRRRGRDRRGGHGGPTPFGNAGRSAPSPAGVAGSDGRGRSVPQPAGAVGAEGRGRGRGKQPTSAPEVSLGNTGSQAAAEKARVATAGGADPPSTGSTRIQADDGNSGGPVKIADDEQGKQKRKRKDLVGKLECAICSEEHFTNQCPLLRGSKPTVAYCGAAEDGMGFFQIQTARNSQIVDNHQKSVAALITVEAGDVSAPLLQAELARIIPVRWEWEVQQQGDKSFVVPFPSKDELERIIAIRNITTKNKEGTIIFEEFVDDVQPIKVLEQVWVTVTKVPRILRSFMPLWAVGSIIGATQKVDMIHLRATGQVRIKVAVMDIKKIPKMADVCAGSCIYRLYFTPDEAPQLDAFNPEDDDLLGDDDNDLQGGDREMEDAEGAHQPVQKNNTTQTLAPNHSGPPQQQASLVKESIDLAVHQLLSEISLKVMLESDDDLSRKTYSPPLEEVMAHLDMLSPNKFLSSVPSLTEITEEVPPGTAGCTEGLSSSLRESVGGSTSLFAPLPVLRESVGGSTSLSAPLTVLDVHSQHASPRPALVTDRPSQGDEEEPPLAPGFEVPALVTDWPSQGAGGSPLPPLSDQPCVGETAYVTTSLQPAGRPDEAPSPPATTLQQAGGSDEVLEACADIQQPVVEGGDTVWTQAGEGSSASTPQATVPGNASTLALPSPLPAAVPAGAADQGDHATLPPASTTHNRGPATPPRSIGEVAPAVNAVPIKVLRRSSRIAATTDMHTRLKAERLTAKKNLELLGNSSTSFPNSKVISNLGRICINLGPSGVVTIKNLEVDRLVLSANQKKGFSKTNASNSASEIEREDHLDAILNHACGDLTENLLEAENDQIIDLSPLRRKKKYNNAKNIYKGKLPKKPKSPSKIIINERGILE